MVSEVSTLGEAASLAVLSLSTYFCRQATASATFVSEPVKMELDLDATEAQLEKVMMEEAILKRQRELQFPKGRRVVSRPKTDPSAPPKKSFWN